MISVIIPFSSDCPYRIAALPRVIDHYEEILENVEHEIIVEKTESTKEYNPAKDRHNGFLKSQGDIIIFADADILPSYKAIHGMIYQLQHNGYYLISPHKQVDYLSPEASKRLIEKNSTLYNDNEVEWKYTYPSFGGSVGTTRKAYDQCGYDSRYINWGSEDISLKHSMEILVGPLLRISETSFHLYHPTNRSATEPALHKEDQKLFSRYEASKNNYTKMLRLVKEHNPITSLKEYTMDKEFILNELDYTLSSSDDPRGLVIGQADWLVEELRNKHPEAYLMGVGGNEKNQLSFLHNIPIHQWQSWPHASQDRFDIIALVELYNEVNPEVLRDLSKRLTKNGVMLVGLQETAIAPWRLKEVGFEILEKEGVASIYRHEPKLGAWMPEHLRKQHPHLALNGKLKEEPQQEAPLKTTDLKDLVAETKENEDNPKKTRKAKASKKDS